ncbi:hypothetical protein 1 [Wenling picorna-like virus 4]|uniref:hypothetical protein 1 n=1 Tax=Wenling picorna-like virus 4 TaxID=1923532 RepID=UPI00090C953C|nr:hypothetical protein 1 [Wenling picorna-like virus 4]APG78474.1 hypothetical protein 1 [Wenling picorna-like virus 4]
MFSKHSNPNQNPLDQFTDQKVWNRVRRTWGDFALCDSAFYHNRRANRRDVTVKQECCHMSLPVKLRTDKLFTYTSSGELVMNCAIPLPLELAQMELTTVPRRGTFVKHDFSKDDHVDPRDVIVYWNYSPVHHHKSFYIYSRRDKDNLLELSRIWNSSSFRLSQEIGESIQGMFALAPRPCGCVSTADHLYFTQSVIANPNVHFMCQNDYYRDLKRAVQKNVDVQCCGYHKAMVVPPPQGYIARPDVMYPEDYGDDECCTPENWNAVYRPFSHMNVRFIPPVMHELMGASGCDDFFGIPDELCGLPIDLNFSSLEGVSKSVIDYIRDQLQPLMRDFAVKVTRNIILALTNMYVILTSLYRRNYDNVLASIVNLLASFEVGADAFEIVYNFVRDSLSAMKQNIFKADDGSLEARGSLVVNAIESIFATIFGAAALSGSFTKSAFVSIRNTLHNSAFLIKDTKVIWSVLGEYVMSTIDAISMHFWGRPFRVVSMETMEPEVTRVNNEFEEINELDIVANCMQSTEFCARILKLRSDIELVRANLVKVKADRAVQELFRSRSADVSRWVSLSSQFGIVEGNSRKAPLIIVLAGQTETGKSTLVDTIVNLFSTVYGIKHSVYRKNFSEKFWDNYSNQSIVVLDDFGQLKDTENKEVSEYETVINIGNCAPYPLEMAACEKKGKVFMTSKLIIITTNAASLQPVSINHPEAFRRRMDAAYEVKLTHSDEKTFNPDRWEFRSFDFNTCQHKMQYDSEPMNLTQLAVDLIALNEWKEGQQSDALKGAASAGIDIGKEVLAQKVSEQGIKRLPRIEVETMESIRKTIEAKKLAAQAEALARKQKNQQKYHAFSQNYVSRPKNHGKKTHDPLNPLHSDAKGLMAPCIAAATTAAMAAYRWFRPVTEIPSLRHCECGRKMFPVYDMSVVHQLISMDVHVKSFSVDQDGEYDIKHGIELKDLTCSSSEQVQSTSAEQEVPLIFPEYFACVNHCTLTRPPDFCKIMAVVKDSANWTKKDYAYLFLQCATASFVVCGIFKALRSYYASTIRAPDKEESTVRFVDFMSREDEKQKKKQKKKKKANNRIRYLLGSSGEYDDEELSAMADQEEADEHMIDFFEEAHRRHINLINESRKLCVDKVSKNFYEVEVSYENRPSCTVSGLFICGQIMATNAHISIDQAKSVKITSFANQSQIVIPACALQSYRVDTQDVLFIRFPKTIRLHSNIVRHFITEEDYTNKDEFNAVLLVWRSLTKPTALLHTCKASPMKEPEMCVYNHDLSTATEITRGYTTDFAAINGDCGAPLVNIDSSHRRICGIMSAGYSNISSTVSLITEGMCEMAVANLMGLEPVGDVNVRVDVQPQLGMIETKYSVIKDVSELRSSDIIGKKKMDYCWTPIYTGIDNVINEGHLSTFTHHQTRTALVPIPRDNFKCIEDTFGKCGVKPAKLVPYYDEKIVDGELEFERVDPFSKALLKFSKEVKHLDEDTLDMAVESYAELFLANPQVKYRKVFDIQTAVAGVDGDDYLQSMNAATSAGYPWMLKYPTKGKTPFLKDKDGNWSPCEEVIVDVQDYLKTIQTHQNVFVATLKDELRDNARVDAGKTRYFAAANMTSVIARRMYFMGVIANNMHNRIFNGSSVGMDCHDVHETTMFVKHMKEVGNNFIAGDFSNYDGSLSPQVLFKCKELIQRFYGDEYSHVREGMFQEIAYAHHYRDGYIYQMDHSLPSGDPLTTLLNTMYNNIIIRYAMLVMKVPMHKLNAEFRINAYGDDNMISVSDEYREMVTPETLTCGLLEANMVYTDEEKTDEIRQHRRMEECTYLKRHIEYENDMYYMPLIESSLTKQLYYVRAPYNRTKELENHENVLMECVLSGPDQYNSYKERLEKYRLAMCFKKQVPAQTYVAMCETLEVPVRKSKKKNFGLDADAKRE